MHKFVNLVSHFEISKCDYKKHFQTWTCMHMTKINMFRIILPVHCFWDFFLSNELNKLKTLKTKPN